MTKEERYIQGRLTKFQKILLFAWIFPALGAFMGMVINAVMNDFFNILYWASGFLVGLAAMIVSFSYLSTVIAPLRIEYHYKSKIK